MTTPAIPTSQRVLRWGAMLAAGALVLLLPLADDGDNVNMILSCSVIERFEEAGRREVDSEAND